MDLKEMSEKLVEVNVEQAGLLLKAQLLINDILLLTETQSNTNDRLDQSITFVMNRNDKEIN